MSLKKFCLVPIVVERALLLQKDVTSIRMVLFVSQQATAAPLVKIDHV